MQVGDVKLSIAERDHEDCIRIQHPFGSAMRFHAVYVPLDAFDGTFINHKNDGTAGVLVKQKGRVRHGYMMMDSFVSAELLASKIERMVRGEKMKQNK